MKSVFIVLFLSIHIFCYSQQNYSSIPVSRDWSKRNIVFEEFNGLKCGYCPEANRMVDSLEKLNPNQFISINIHSGIFAEPNSSFLTDLRVSSGERIDTFSHIWSYPAGNINRVSFFLPYDYRAIFRDDYINRVNQVKAYDSKMNIGSELYIDSIKKKMYIKIQTYYFDTTEDKTNYLHIALLQDSIGGDQNFGLIYYPENCFNFDQYWHNKVLREMVTGFYGLPISTQQGVVFDTMMEVNLKDKYGQIPFVYKNAKVVIYVSQDSFNIWNGVKSIPIFSNIPKDIFAETGTVPSSLGDHTVNGKLNIVGEKNFSWEINKIEMPENWKIKTITTSRGSVNYSTGISGNFDALPSASANFINLNIEHQNTINSGNIWVNLWETNNKANTMRSYKYRLQTKISSNILQRDISKQEFYFSENVLYFPENMNRSLDIYTIYGRKVKTINSNQKEIKINDLSCGIYILNVTDKYGNQSQKKIQILD